MNQIIAKFNSKKTDQNRNNFSSKYTRDFFLKIHKFKEINPEEKKIKGFFVQRVVISLNDFENFLQGQAAHLINKIIMVAHDNKSNKNYFYYDLHRKFFSNDANVIAILKKIKANYHKKNYHNNFQCTLFGYEYKRNYCWSKDEKSPFFIKKIDLKFDQNQFNTTQFNNGQEMNNLDGSNSVIANKKQLGFLNTINSTQINYDQHQQIWLRSRFWLILLSLLFGYLGLDRFYAGSKIYGWLKLLTLGGLGLWWLFDLMLALFGNIKDINGFFIDKWTISFFSKY
ncbi:TM2 domain-containing protein [[Mycoplasma] cavipharyngis]|uniref:NINE protein n=1 Tax=[Mycoplasma] cavipharyngis TaxID=92757 RepID=UPI003703D1DA